MDMPVVSRGRRNSVVQPASNHIYQERAARWVLRLLLEGKGYRFFISNGEFKDDNVLRLVGLEDYVGKPVNLKDGLQLLNARYQELEAKPPRMGFLDLNLAKLTRSIGLSSVECAMLGFLSLLERIWMVCWMPFSSLPLTNLFRSWSR